MVASYKKNNSGFLFLYQLIEDISFAIGIPGYLLHFFSQPSVQISEL